MLDAPVPVPLVVECVGTGGALRLALTTMPGFIIGALVEEEAYCRPDVAEVEAVLCAVLAPRGARAPAPCRLRLVRCARAAELELVPEPELVAVEGRDMLTVWMA